MPFSGGGEDKPLLEAGSNVGSTSGEDKSKYIAVEAEVFSRHGSHGFPNVDLSPTKTTVT